MIEIEKPNIVTLDVSEGGEKATFVIEPLERGYGITLGNSLRRVLISSLPGYAVTSIRTSRNSYSVSRGKTAKIGIYVNPSYASNRSVTLTTSNKNIATVNSKGYIKGIRKGKCTITIKSRDGSLKSKSVTVTVK